MWENMASLISEKVPFTRLLQKNTGRHHQQETTAIMGGGGK